MKKTPSIIGVLLLATVSICHAKQAVVTSYGRYANLGVIATYPEKEGFVFHSLSNQTLICKTNVIDAKVGNAFGFEFELVSYTNENDSLIFHTIPPAPITTPDGKEYSDFTFTRSVRHTLCNPFIGYLFENEWECVPGKWILQLIDGDKVILEMGFHVKQ